PLRILGEVGPCRLAMREAVIGPEMDDPVEGADLAGEEADEPAQQALLDRQAALAIEGEPFLHLARLYGVGPLLDDHHWLLGRRDAPQNVSSADRGRARAWRRARCGGRASAAPLPPRPSRRA